LPGQNAYLVPIPAGITGGKNFRVYIEGQQLQVTCPPGLTARNLVRVAAPAPLPTTPNNTTPTQGIDIANSNDSTSTDNNEQQQRLLQRPEVTMQTFEVAVPQGVRPGQPFTLIASGQRVLVTCPPNAVMGQRIRFELPIAGQTGRNSSAPSNTATNNTNTNTDNNGDDISPVQLSYETKDGWTRTIRLTDYKFTWVRTQANQVTETQDKNFDLITSAFARKLIFKDGADPRMRTGKVSLVPASNVAVESSVSYGLHNEKQIKYADIATAQNKKFQDKVVWFQDMCALLKVDWSAGHVKIQVRREHLLDDSIQAVMSLGRTNLRESWRLEFIGELGLDAGGLIREWFQLVSEDIFNPDRGLWNSNEGNQMCNQINAAAELTCGPEYRIYYRFLGRVMGKALFDQQLIAGHMVRHLYKHILGWPMTFADLEMIDEQYFQNMKKMTTYSEDELEMLCLDFTYTEQSLGASEIVELIPDGKNVDVTKENLAEYLELCTKYRLLGRIRPHVTELLLGFFDVIPEPLMTVFDFQELELLMCGLPEVDMQDWKANTDYAGLVKENHRVVGWFWEVVEDFDVTMRAKLLQFVTGTSGVPSGGFSVLQGNDGDIRKFCINGIALSGSLYPRSHTCFNRIDLPLYKTKKDLHDNLKMALECEAVGFGIE